MKNSHTRANAHKNFPIIYAQEFPLYIRTQKTPTISHHIIISAIVSLSEQFLFAYVLMFQRAYVTMSYVSMSKRNSRITFSLMFFLCLVKSAFLVGLFRLIPFIYFISFSISFISFPLIRVNLSRFNLKNSIIYPF